MGENYVVSVPDLKKPRVKITGVDQGVKEDDLIVGLKRQNERLANGEFKLMNMFKTKRNDATAIIELDAVSFEHCMKARKVKFGWSICSIGEDLNVFRCFKCNGYNHKHNQCTNKLACQRCAQNHDHRVCKSRTEVCVNCKIANEKYNVRLNTNHAATSDRCPVYLKKVDAERRKIKYSM